MSKNFNIDKTAKTFKKIQLFVIMSLEINKYCALPTSII